MLPLPPHVLKTADDWAPVFKVLGDPTRLRLLVTMHHQGPGRRSVTELAEATGVRTVTASAALTSMAAAGIIEPTREGRETRYALTDPRVHDLLHHVGAPHATDGR